MKIPVVPLTREQLVRRKYVLMDELDLIRSMRSEETVADELAAVEFLLGEAK